MQRAPMHRISCRLVAGTFGADPKGYPIQRRSPMALRKPSCSSKPNGTFPGRSRRISKSIPTLRSRCRNSAVTCRRDCSPRHSPMEACMCFARRCRCVTVAGNAHHRRRRNGGSAITFRRITPADSFQQHDKTGLFEVAIGCECFANPLPLHRCKRCAIDERPLFIGTLGIQFHRFTK